MYRVSEQQTPNTPPSRQGAQAALWQLRSRSACACYPSNSLGHANHLTDARSGYRPQRRPQTGPERNVSGLGADVSGFGSASCRRGSQKPGEPTHTWPHSVLVPLVRQLRAQGRVYRRSEWLSPAQQGAGRPIRKCIGFWDWYLVEMMDLELKSRNLLTSEVTMAPV